MFDLSVTDIAIKKIFCESFHQLFMYNIILKEHCVEGPIYKKIN